MTSSVVPPFHPKGMTPEAYWQGYTLETSQQDKTARGVIHGKFPLCPFRSTCKNLCQALIFVSLNRKNITSTPPCNCALKSLILALRDSAEALVARLMKQLSISPCLSAMVVATVQKFLSPKSYITYPPCTCSTSSLLFLLSLYEAKEVRALQGFHHSIAVSVGSRMSGEHAV